MRGTGSATSPTFAAERSQRDDVPPPREACGKAREHEARIGSVGIGRKQAGAAEQAADAQSLPGLAAEDGLEQLEQIDR